MTFWFLVGSKNFLQAPFSFLRRFCFTRIWLNPLSSQSWRHNCISVIVSRFRSFTKDFVICCYQATNIFFTRYDITSTSSARRPCNFSPLADLPISVFREVNINTVFAWYHSSLWLQRGFMRRTQVWVSILGDSAIRKIHSEFFQPFRYFGKWLVAPYLLMVHIFIGFRVLGWVRRRVASCSLVCTLTFNWCWNRCWTCTFVR